jgi:cyclophilin family peptidyl-prolyl cis-trans isomerase
MLFEVGLNYKSHKIEPDSLGPDLILTTGVNMIKQVFVFTLGLTLAAGQQARSEGEPPTPVEVAVESPAPESAVQQGEIATQQEESQMVRMETTLGTIEIELWSKAAPATVQNILQYVKDGFYDGTIFHRVIPGFVIQGGGFNADFVQKKNRAPVINEAKADYPNSRGTLSMARTSDINSATSQFFINLSDNASLDHRSESPSGFGYAVFGKVTKGMDVVDKIAAVQTGNHGPYADAPVENVVITKVSVVEAAK